MALILSLETSSGICSVALHKDKDLLALAEVHEEYAHASKLGVLIQEVAHQAAVEMREISAVAVSAGPGSYTGLRIGTSTAKGLCYALGVPLLAVGTLEIMASQVTGIDRGGSLLCPMIDARRMEVYCSLFNPERKMIREVEARIIDEKSFEQELSERPIYFFGNGSGKCKNVIAHSNAHFIEGIDPSARQLGINAAIKLDSGDVEDLLKFEPFYLKEFKAKKPANLIPSAPNKL